MDSEQIVIRLGAALLLGAAIGLERQWRSHYVGLRTNALITTGSAALMLLAVMLPVTGDVTSLSRIASQIITGVGFLCAGVIMHEGVNVKGFNTAATIWCSTVVGMFAGMGLFLPAAILTVLILLVNLFMLPIVNLINTRTSALEESDAHYRITITCRPVDMAQVRSAVVSCVQAHKANLKSLESKCSQEAGAMEINAEILPGARDNALVEKILQEIGQTAAITSAQWQVY